MKSDKPSSLPHFPARLLAFALGITAAATIWLAWNVYDSTRFAAEWQHRYLRSVQLQGKIIHLDEVLTMSARMAAATGDLKWEERYRRFEPELDAAIKEATQLAPQPALVQMAAQTDAANLKLVDMEDRAFALVKQGQLEQARAVLFSPAYEEQKQIYAGGITRLIAELNQQWNVRMHSRTIEVRFSLLSAGAVLVALLVAWFTALRTLTRWRAAFQRAHDNLELRVQERTTALQASENRFRGLFDSSRDAVMTLEPPSWKFTSGNPATVAMFGARNEEHFTSLGPWDVSPERQPDGQASAEKAKAMIETAMREGSHFFEWTHQRTNGQAFPATVLLSRMEAAGKAFLQATVRDITEQQRAELEIQRQAAFPRLNPNPVLELSAAGEINFSNEATGEMARALGLEHPAQMLPPNTAAMVRECLATGKPKLRVETQIGPRVISWSFFPVKSSNSVHGYAGDITERKRAEEKIQQLSRAVEQNPASIVITDPAGNIEYVNPKFAEVTGYTLAEALGQNPRILKSGERSPESYRELWQTITAGKEWRGEFHNKKKNGELYWESASISPIRNPAGVITHFLAVKEDITARKQTEAERDQLIQELQQALATVKSLSGLLPICASCKKIRDDKGYWSQVESYVAKHSEATFTHGICPDCAKKLYPELYDSVPEPTTPGTPAGKDPPRVTSEQ